MYKKLFFSSFLVLSLLGVIYPIQKEGTKLFDYCYSLEKLITRNSLRKRENLSKRGKSITKDLIKLGLSSTRGALIINAIDQYKKAKNLFIVTIIPNQFYCFMGYWIEEVKPGLFEAIFLEKSKQKLDELKDRKGELDIFLRDVKSEYRNLKKDFNSFF